MKTPATFGSIAYLLIARHRAVPLTLAFLVGVVSLVGTSTTPAANEAASEPNRAALLASAREPLEFESFCFSGDQFPACAFRNPERVARLIGPYTLQTNWYDAEG